MKSGSLGLFLCMLTMSVKSLTQVLLNGFFRRMLACMCYKVRTYRRERETTMFAHLKIPPKNWLKLIDGSQVPTYVLC